MKPSASYVVRDDVGEDFTNFCLFIPICCWGAQFSLLCRIDVDV